MKSTIRSSLNIKYHKLPSHIFDAQVSIQSSKLVTKIYRKSTYRQNFLHVDAEHPKSLKDSIPYSQVLKIKWIRNKPNDFNQYCEELKQRFVHQGYKPELINKHIKSVEKMDRKKLLKEKENNTSNKKNSFSINI